MKLGTIACLCLFTNLFLITSAKSDSLNSSLEDTIEYVDEALDAAEDAPRSCRRAAGKHIKSAKRLLSDLRRNFTRRNFKRAEAKLEDAADESEDSCPRAVERSLQRAIEAMDSVRDIAKSTIAHYSPTTKQQDTNVVPVRTESCNVFLIMFALAQLSNSQPAVLQTIRKAGRYYCAPNQPNAAWIEWGNGITARYTSGELRYPDNIVMHYPTNNEYRYANGNVAQYHSGQWHYPNGNIAAYANGQWHAPDGTATTPEQILEQRCSELGPRACQGWRELLNAESTGFFHSVITIQIATLPIATLRRCAHQRGDDLYFCL